MNDDSLSLELVDEKSSSPFLLQKITMLLDWLALNGPN